MKNDSFKCIFQRFHCLIHFMLSVENQIKHWINEMLYVIWYHLYNFKNGEKHPWMSDNFSKSIAHPWVFFMFFKLYKWYQIVQSITNKIKDTKKKKIMKDNGRNAHKEENWKRWNLVFVVYRFICTNCLVHPLANKSRWLIVVQRSYCSF